MKRKLIETEEAEETVEDEAISKKVKNDGKFLKEFLVFTNNLIIL